MPSEHVMKPEGLRLAHSDGYTDICYSKDGRLVSAGDDGYACIWSESDAEDSQMSQSLGDSVSSIGLIKDELYAVVSNFTLAAHDFPSCSFNRICLKLSDNISHFAADISESTLAVGSADFKIRLLDRETLSVPTVLQDHLAPILSVAYSAEHLASSSCDSTVRLWSPKDGKCISTFGRVIPKSNDVANSPTLCRLQFSRDGNLLYVPTEGEIKVYDVRNWHKPHSKIDLPKKTSVASWVRFSPDGSHFATICKDVIAVYSMAKSNWISRMTNSKPISCVAWNPTISGRLAFTDSRGQLGFLSTPLEKNIEPDDVDMDDDAAIMAIAAELGDENSDASDKDNDAVLKMSDDEEEFKELKETKQAQNPQKTKSDDKKEELKKISMSDDEDDFAPLALEDDEATKSDYGDPITDLGRIRNEFKEFFDSDEDDDDDVNKKPTKKASTPTKSTLAPADPILGSKPVAPAKPIDAHLQKSFQVHSTPAGRGGQNSRFLVWNQLGVVRLYETESENSIEVEFHDVSVHPPISLSSSDDFTLAALTADALVLCLMNSNPEAEDDEVVCKIRVLTLSAWDSSREWTLELPSDETCVSVAVGSSWIAVVSSSGYIRLFTLAGFQLGMLSFSGTPVTAVGRDAFFAVIYHNGIGAKDCQNFGFDLYKISSRTPKMIASGNLPIAPRSNLTWAGFGQDLFTFVTVDSKEVVRAYSIANRTWTPIANLRKCGNVKSRSDHFWMVGLSEKMQQIFAIFCKAGNYPAVLPRPIMSTVPLGVPLCEINSDAGRLADEAIRMKLFEQVESQEDSNIKLQETLMRLFAIAIKQDRHCRAAEIAESMPTSVAIQLASKYAARLRLGHLADVLNDVALKRQLEVEQPPSFEDDPVFSSDYSAPSVYSSQKEEDPKEKLPVLATPPVVSLVKRQPGATPSGLAKDFAPPKSTEPPAKSNEVEEIVEDDDGDDEREEIEEDEEEGVEEVEPPKAVESVSKNPFAKAPASKGNPFRKSAPGAATGTPGDALSCFEKVEVSRPKVAATTNNKEQGRKKRQSTAEDKPAKRKRTAAKRKNEVEESGNSHGATTEAGDENTNDANDKPAAKKAAPNPSTVRKLTDFMFTKNDD